MVKYTNKEEKVEFNFVELIGQQLIGTNNVAFSEVSPEQLEKGSKKRDLYGYNFERVWENGTLDKVFDNPECMLEQTYYLTKIDTPYVDATFHGYNVNKGADYLFAAKILYDLVKSTFDSNYFSKKIKFQAGVSLAKWESGVRPEQLQLERSYDLQVDLTREYYLRKLLKHEQECDAIAKRFENLVLPVTLRTQEAIEQ